MSFLKRWLARLAFRGVVKDALTGNTNKDWVTVDGNPEDTVGGDSARATLRSRARSLELNSGIVKRAVEVICGNVVGGGIRPEIDTGNREIDALIEKHWERWCHECDITGGSTFYEMQQMILRRVYVDGEIFVNDVLDKGSKYVLRLQMLEPNALDEGLCVEPATKGNTIASGVEIDDYCRPVGYWFSTNASNPYSTDLRYETRFHKAENVHHLFFKVRPQQIRGVSLLTSIINLIRDIGEYMDAKVIAAKIAACLAVFVTSPDVASRWEQNATDETGKRVKSIKPATVNYLRPGETIETASPSGAESGSTDVLASQLRLVALGLNLSYELLSGDLSRVNFSSGRMGSQEDRKHFRRDQQWLIAHFCRPIFRKWLDANVLNGNIPIPDYAQDPEKYSEAVSWKCPGWQWVDPLKEVNAYKESLKAGIVTLSEICANQGLDYAEVLEQLSKEKRLAEELGLELDIFMPEGGVKEDDAEGDGDDPDKEQ